MSNLVHNINKSTSIKGKDHPITNHEGPEGEQMYTSTLPSTSALDEGGWSTPRPCRFTPEKTRYPLYRRLGGPQGRSGRVRKISPLPGFDPRTVQPVDSRYTDWATQPTALHVACFKFYIIMAWWCSSDWNLLPVSWIIKYCCVWLKTYIYLLLFFNSITQRGVKLYIFTSDTTVIHNSKYYKLIVRGYMFRLLMQPSLGQL